MLPLPHLDHFGSYVVAAFLVTVLLLGGYTAYLWSRLTGLERRLVTRPPQAEEPEDPSRAGIS